MKPPAILCLFLLSMLPLQAATVAAVDPVEDGRSSIFVVSVTVGWTFTVNSGLTVRELGYYDFGADGLSLEHEVGIWKLGGPLLGSVTVTTTDPVSDGFRYAAVTPFQLIAGQSYVIGGFQAQGNDPTLTGFGYSSLTTPPEISYGESRVALSGALSRPDGNPFDIVKGGVFGPNFKYDVSAPASVPDGGSTLVLGTLSLLGLAGAQRLSAHRRRTA